MKKHERYTENLVEQRLRQLGYDETEFQFQGSIDEDIQAFLPSKRSGTDGKGRSEFIIRLNGDAADLLVIECKNDVDKHASAANLTEDSKLRSADFSEDGILHYMKGLRREYNVIGLAISGFKKDALEITTFKALRGSRIERLPNDTILQRTAYLSLLRATSGYGEKSELEIIQFAEDLHDFLRDNMELSEALKPLIVSGILLALKDAGFEASYRKISNGSDLAEATIEAIRRTLRKAKVKEEKLEAMLSSYQFIKNDKNVRKFLSQTVGKIYRNLFFALQPDSGIDLLGNFYGEFLRYSGGDKKGLGIVLTPRHITELFADIADLNPKESVILDICAGTGGFLIAAMANMLGKAKANPAIIKRIKEHGLIGTELDSQMFTLACANMIFRGDGKANMFWDDCLVNHEKGVTDRKIRGMKPNVAMLNPPYAKKTNDKHELAYVLKALDLLEPNGTCIAIVPISAIIEDKKSTLTIKREMLKRHTLRAAASMPNQLFPGTGVIASIIILTAHRPHNPQKESWFGYWKDDGYRLLKGKRMEREPGIWQKIRRSWLDAYFNETARPGESCKKIVTAEMEWCAEAYLETDYSKFDKNVFETALQDYAIYRLRNRLDEKN